MLGDRVRLTQVVQNLLINARKHGDDQAEIVLRSLVLTRDGRRWARVEVRDQGPGVPVGQRDHLFERFFQAGGREKRGSRMGLGLGLYISRGIVEQLGGRVGADFESGTTFWVELPLAEPQA